MNDGQAAERLPHDADSELQSVFDHVNFFSGKLREAIESLPGHLRFCDEVELNDFARPTPSDWKMRNQFNRLFNQAKAEGEEGSVTMSAVIDGAMTRQYFFEKIVTNPNKIAFIIRPVVDHTEYYETIQKIGLRKIIRYMEENEIDPKNLAQFMKLVEKATDRVHGAVAQKMQIQSKNLNVEMHASAALPPAQGTEDIQARITQLNAKLLDTGVRDVTGEDQDPS